MVGIKYMDTKKQRGNDPFDYYTFIEVFNDFLDHINEQNKGLGLKRTGGSMLKTYDPNTKQKLKIDEWENLNE